MRTFDYGTIIFETAFGSHLYGTDTPSSDRDYKGVFIPKLDDILLGRAPRTVQLNTKSDTTKRNSSEDVDVEYYSLQKFIELCDKGETVALDMLFSTESLWMETSCVWEFIVANRSKLVSRKSKAFIGYCLTQAAKYGIKGSRVNAVRRVIGFLSDKDPAVRLECYRDGLLALAEEHILVIEIPASPKTPDVTVPALEVCGRKILLRDSVKHALDILRKIDENYGERARQAATNQGIDWKALSHAVRVCGEALELLKTGHITFPIGNRDIVLSIKSGKLSYAEVSELLEKMMAEVASAEAVSTLPESIDHDFWDLFLVHAYKNQNPCCFFGFGYLPARM